MLSPARLSLLVAPVLACAGAAGKPAPVAADLPPTVDCGKTIDALAPILDTPAVALVGERAADVARLVGDLACQVASGGHQVVVALEPEPASPGKRELIDRVARMRAAGLDVDLARDKLAASVQRVATQKPDARLIVLGDTPEAIRGVPAYVIDVVGDPATASARAALHANPQREDGFDAVLDLGAAPAQAAQAAPVPEG